MRAVVPVLLLALASVVVGAFFLSSKNQKTAPSPTPPVVAASPETPPNPVASAPATSAAEPAPNTPPMADAKPSIAPAPETAIPPARVPGLHIRSFEPSATPPVALGSLDGADGYRAELRFTGLGAGVESITATDYFATVHDKYAHARGNPDAQHYEIQTRGRVQNADGTASSVVSLAALGATINGQFVNLFSDVHDGVVRHVWRETAPGTFVAEIVDDKDAVVARVTRTYELDKSSFLFRVRQEFKNLTTQPMKVEWVQYGPVDLSEDKTGYSLDVRRLRFGYLMVPAAQRSPGFVEVDTRLMGRSSLVKRWNEQRGVLPPLWPDAGKFKRAESLSWVGQTSRYFAFVVLPLVSDPTAAVVNKVLPIGARVDAVVLGFDRDARVALQLSSPSYDVPAGGTADLSFAAYAGPLAREQLSSRANPVFGLLGLDRLVIYNLGGMCAFCTFQWIAVPLVRFLAFLHDYIVFDWAIAIMILVCVVRACLHPITRRSQIGMQRFAKQMQRIGPKQKKLQEKYRDEPKVLQAEIAKLMREENVSYRGALGCLPMFLQTPIWIAVYAVIYFTFALRHEAAFFGVFQSLTNGSWTFLADLSAPDHFIEFGRSLHIPLLSGMMGPISGINILPLILGVVFFIQQKYLTPPPSAPLTPEQETQQKMMKIMMVVMFPLFMYNAPSALALYFLTNSTLGILESRYIRAHIDQLDLDGPAKPKAFGQRKQVANQARNPFKKERDKARFKDRE